MGTTFSIILYGSDSARMESAIEAAFREACRVDGLLSNYLPRSEWSEMNRYADRRPVEVSAELLQLLTDCLEYSRLSEGAFDISVGPLVEAWGFSGGHGRLPDGEEMSAANSAVGYRHVRLDHAKSTVQFDVPGVKLNPGGIGKGYAVDRMADLLRHAGFDTALIAGSASSIYGLGAPPTEPRGWPVDIRHARKCLTDLYLKDMALSTTGTSEQSFIAGGEVFSHIFDPRTGRPAPGMLLASVISPRTIDSEAWTKPCFIHGREWVQAHKPAGFRVFLYEDVPHRAGVWL